MIAEAMRNVYGIEADLSYNTKFKEATSMYIVTNSVRVKKDQAHLLVERFNKTGVVETMPGFLGLEVQVAQKLKKDYDVVNVVTKWESEAAFQNWVTSDAFKEAHAHRGDKGGIPEFVIDNHVHYYDVKVVRNPIAEPEAQAQ